MSEQRRERSPWRWPVGTLIALVIIVLAGVVIALVACAPSGRTTTNNNDSGTIKTQTSTRGLEERKVTLSDGRIVTCITWVDSGYQYENTASGISCDWTVEVSGE